MTEAALDRSAQRVRAAAESLVASGALEALPTFFECTTAVAFDLFREARVKIAVLEVGLGGRLDATNIVTPIAGAIVSIDFDHEALLGHTLAAIAAEKAGIIKRGMPVVCGPLPAEAMMVVAQVCAERSATLIQTADDDELAARIAALPLALDGAHQRANAAVAWRLLVVIDEFGVAVDEPAIMRGLTQARWPARLEWFPFRRHGLLIDAAHNPAGARALASYLAERAPAGAAFVFAAMQDKNVDAILEALKPAVARMICATAPTPRAFAAEALAARARALGITAEAVDDPADAVRRAAEEDRLVVVAGSIFLAGPVRDLVEHGILR